MNSCPYVPPVFLAPFSLPLMRMLAYCFPDRSLREARRALALCRSFAALQGTLGVA